MYQKAMTAAIIVATAPCHNSPVPATSQVNAVKAVRLAASWVGGCAARRSRTSIDPAAKKIAASMSNATSSLAPAWIGIS